MFNPHLYFIHSYLDADEIGIMTKEHQRITLQDYIRPTIRFAGV